MHTHTAFAYQGLCSFKYDYFLSRIIPKTHNWRVRYPKFLMKQTFTYYAHVDLSSLLLEFSTSLNGLDAKTAHTHLAKYGPNTFDLSRKRPAVIEWLASFFSPLPILLLILCAVSWMVGEAKGALVIGSMVFLSITLAFIQEHRSTRAAEKLKELVSIKISVIRHGELIDIPMREVVPGDLVNLSAGDIIPGDLRLIEAKDLFVDQSSLTGEAIPAEKQAHAVQQAGTRGLLGRVVRPVPHGRADPRRDRRRTLGQDHDRQAQR